MVYINHQKQRWDCEIAWVDPRSSQGKFRFSLEETHIYRWPSEAMVLDRQRGDGCEDAPGRSLTTQHCSGASVYQFHHLHLVLVPPEQ